MTRGAGIVIIGGGVAGASVAYHLAERGINDLLVLDRAASLGSGSTGKATGGIRAQFDTDINTKMSLYSIDFFKDWEFNAEYEPKGYLFLATNNLHLDYLNRSGDRQRELGYEGVHLVTQDEIARMVPGLNSQDIVGGSFGPRDGFINPLAVLERLYGWSFDADNLKRCWGAWESSGMSQVSLRFRGPYHEKYAGKEPYHWMVGFKNTSAGILTVFPKLIFGDGTSLDGGYVLLTPGAEYQWDAIKSTQSNSPRVTLQITKWAYCPNAIRTTDNGSPAYKCVGR